MFFTSDEGEFRLIGQFVGHPIQLCRTGRSGTNTFIRWLEQEVLTVISLKQATERVVERKAG